MKSSSSTPWIKRRGYEKGLQKGCLVAELRFRSMRRKPGWLAACVRAAGGGDDAAVAADLALKDGAIVAQDCLDDGVVS
jgi:hypothetical protein